MRLIDADKLLETIKVHDYPLKDHLNSTDNGMFTIGIQQDVDEQPAVDAVPVVRCRECKWYKEGKLLGPTKFCFRLRDADGERIGYNFASDDFCSHGERKGGADDGE